MSQLRIEVSAPGKVILHGEHSVVYGKMALAASLDRRTYVHLTENLNFKLNLNFPSVNLNHSFDLNILQLKLVDIIPLIVPKSNFNWETPHLIDHNKYISIITEFLEQNINDKEILNMLSKKMALISFFYVYIGIFSILNLENLPSIDIVVTTDLKVSSGTGSSASFCVALIGALVQFMRIKLLKNKQCVKNGYKEFKITNMALNSFDANEKDIIGKWALAAEKVMHGNPSGIDPAVCTYGSLIEFRKGSPVKPIKLCNGIRMMLVDTLSPRNTKQLVAHVAELKQRHPIIVDHIMEALDNLAETARDHLLHLDGLSKQGTGDNQQINKEYMFLQELLVMNHGLLTTLGVSHSTLESICATVAKYNLAAKLTGAGGGGYAIVILPPMCSEVTERQLSDDLETQGFQVYVTVVGGRGLSIDNCTSKSD